MKTLRSITGFLAVAFALCACYLALAAQASEPERDRLIPMLAYQLQGDLTNISQAEFGLHAPVARIAAQTYVESAWNPTAESPYAQGLTQFVPATAEWIATLRPDLSPADPFDPMWSLRAAVLFDSWLLEHIEPSSRAERAVLTVTEHWAMSLSAYNGGIGWLGRDRQLTADNGMNPDQWFGHVELFSNRADWAFEENRKYPVKILCQWEPRFINAGWPGESVCPDSR